MWKKQAEDIRNFMEGIPEESSTAVKPSRDQFTRLLSAPAAARKIPGISKRLDENSGYRCSNGEAVQTKAFLKKMFNVDSKDSLTGFQKMQFRGSVHYEQFMTFWKGAPLFDVKELNREAKKAFENSMDQAASFYPILQEKGFYAWDISEYLGICRCALACGIINDQEFDEIVDPFVRKAQAFYHSFKEYAMSLLCGSIYFMASGRPDPKGIDSFLDIQKSIVSNLFENGAPWQHYAWYKPAEREWARIYPGNPGCFLTKAAYENGIGYMYRQEGTPGRPDSGWRFFHGDESDDYANNPDNIQIVSLNTICNLRPDILAFLEAPVNTAYGYNGSDWVKEPFQGE